MIRLGLSLALKLLIAFCSLTNKSRRRTFPWQTILPLTVRSARPFSRCNKSNAIRRLSQRRLSFGRKIVDVTDGATQFFQARGLTNRIVDTRERGEQVDQAISALQTFVGGTQSLQEQLRIARGHVLRAEANLEATAELTRVAITVDFSGGAEELLRERERAPVQRLEPTDR